MTELSLVAVLTSFAAGVISFLSPCVLPLVPGYLSYVAGHSFANRTPRTDMVARSAALRSSLFFVLGFSTVFIILGASATALGQLLLSYRYEANIAAGLGLPFLAAALLTEWLLDHLRLLARAGRVLQIGAGALLVTMGAAMITGELSAFSYWLLETFPAFSRIG
jgi:cytochrome c-type biogenesis protein